MTNVSIASISSVGPRQKRRVSTDEKKKKGDSSSREASCFSQATLEACGWTFPENVEDALVYQARGRACHQFGKQLLNALRNETSEIEKFVEGEQTCKNTSYIKYIIYKSPPY